MRSAASTVARRDLEDARRGVEDPPHGGVRPLAVVPDELFGDVDHTTRVDDEVGRVEHTRLLQERPALRLRELVVGGADHRRAVQLGDGDSVERRAERARRVDVAFDRVDLLDRDALDPEAVRDALDGSGVDVGNRHPRPLLDQVAHEVGAHLADARDADVTALEVGRPPEPAAHRLHRVEHAVGGGRGGVTGAPERSAHPGDVPGLAADEVHVRLGRAHVLGRDVAPAERLDEAAVDPDEGLGPGRGGVPEDHCLATAEVEARGRRLVGHAPRQPQDVGERVVLRRVRVEAGATQGGAEPGGVDGDDRPQSGGPVVAVHDLLVIVRSDAVEHVHADPSVQARPTAARA